MKIDCNIDWDVSEGLTPYPEAVARMEALQAAIRDENARELIWLLEHPPVYTAGTSAATPDLIDTVIDECGKFCAEVLAPLNQIGDKEGCTRNPDGSVTTPTGLWSATARQGAAPTRWTSACCAA